MDTSSLPEILRYGGSVLLMVGVTMYFFYKRRGGETTSFTTKNVGGGVGCLGGFAVDLTVLAREGKIDPVVGRAEEIMRVTQVLTRRTKNNVILAGPPGVGKTAIVEGLAMGIVTGDVPQVLRNKRILSLRVSELLAGTKYRGEFEQRVKKIVDEIRISNRTIILFIDEIHTVMQTRGAEGAVNFSDILKPALARGDLQLIGATTEKEYNEFIAPDESVARRFQMVLVDEPTVAETIQILHGIKKNYETFHQVKFTDEAIEAAARLSHEYIKGRRLPDKAIDVMDEAAAMVNVKEGLPVDHAVALLHGAAGKVSGNKSDLSEEMARLQKELVSLHSQEEKTQDEKALVSVRKKIVDKVKEIEEYSAAQKGDQGWIEVGVEHIKEVVADWVGMKKNEIH
ncbi:MAG: ATP-dependent Clp protease ATP-binding subunit [Candidatus Magasanikbacteria bacterium]|nr:ATP-dependent Clp protease ATP-binding subunit [Candidatus Magasanikbacteria bacterium]